jgi:hypothetical protein
VIYFDNVFESDTLNTMEVWLSTVDDVAGFQFDISGAEVTGASGGVEDLGWTVNFNADGTVLGFDLAGSVIAAGSTALLTTLSFNINDFEACLDFGTGAISDATGTALPSGTGDCFTYATAIGGCTDMGACNYNTEANADDGSCTYAEGTCDCNGDSTDDYCDCDGNMLDECGVCGGTGPDLGNAFSCADVPDDFAYNQSSNQAFYYVTDINDIYGSALEPNDWVGVFNGSVCVGSRLWNTIDCAGTSQIPPAQSIVFHRRDPTHTEPLNTPTQSLGSRALPYISLMSVT